jgi:hypothetical protein
MEKNISPEEAAIFAAFDTFTGKMAKSKGFDKVVKISGPKNTDGTYKFVTGAYFSKSK